MKSQDVIKEAEASAKASGYEDPPFRIECAGCYKSGKHNFMIGFLGARVDSLTGKIQLLEEEIQRLKRNGGLSDKEFDDMLEDMAEQAGVE